jgi:hypothetical protein
MVDGIRGRGAAQPGQRELYDALASYALSRDTTLPAQLRLCALEASVHGLTRACRARSTPLRLASLARAAADFGARGIAIESLQVLYTRLTAAEAIEADEPFIAPSARFDTVERRGALRDWLLAATLAALDRLASFSSYYDGAAATARLGRIDALGYGDADVAHRLELLRRRAAVRTAAARRP